MNKQNLNELEGIQNPYEIEFSSLKSSKNDSSKTQKNKLKILNNNLSSNNNINNQKKLFKNSQNLNSINSFKSFSNNNDISKNFRLNSNTRNNLENYMKENKTEINKKKLNNKIKNQNKNSNKNPKNNNYSKISNYWEDRDKKNKIKMERIKKEREDKIYGELYPKPKISKNTKEIIERIKERNFELALENEKEEEINSNIPIKTKEKNYFFKTVYYTNKVKLKSKNKNKKPMNKSFSKINVNIKKGAKNTKLKRNKTARNKRPYNKGKLNFSIADIKSLEMIQQLRQKEIDEKIKEEEKPNLINKKINEKKIKDKNESSREKDFINKSMDILSIKSNNFNLDYLNEIITSRQYLNEIYNKNKKITNHSFILNSTNDTKSSNIKKINITYRNKSSSNHKMSKTFDNKNIKNKKRIKNSKEYGLYDPMSHSLRYQHYKDISKSYVDFIKSNDNYNKSYNKSYNSSNNIIIQSNNKSISFPEINKSNTKKNKKNLCFTFDREMEEKKEELNQIYTKEFKQKTNEINKIENELKERNLINKKLITESKIDDKEFQKIILKNDYINNQYNELDKESLLKFREENVKKLEELRQKENKFNPSQISNIRKEEEKNNMQDNNKINVMKYKSLLDNAQQKIENNLELYNNELKINELKKRAILNKLFDNDYKKGIALENDDDINTNEFQLGVNKYLVSSDINKENNFIYKYLSKRNKNETDKEISNKYNENIVENFDFQRKHHF